MIRTFVICLAISCTQAFVFDDPCDINLQSGLNRPNGTSFMSDELVPNGCINGSITWNYPMGHGRVHFMNQHHKTMSVCIRDGFGMFTISDVTNGSPGIPIGNFTREEYACTLQSTAINLILQRDASDNLFYVGSVYFLVKN